IIASFSGIAQVFPAKNYPQGYFQWPIAAKVGLAANFGELRPNHYHMGLDCRSDQVENRPVYAAAEGYIAKVRIDPSGFGRCIMINHPNGLTTLYAHLNDFDPAIEKYVKEQQYKLQSWKVLLDIPAHLLPVKKGQFIAYSGNTGGSQGPHLHFEIRDTKTDKVLNPLLFGFPVADNIAPDILRLAVYDRSISTYEQTPRIYALRKVNGVYVPTPSLIIAHSDKISFAITAYDRYSGSTNQNGIYEAVLYDDEKAVVGFQLDSITYDETRYLNAHIDYKLKLSGGPYVQHLSKLPGYPDNGIYKQISGDGVIQLKDNNVHSIEINVKDVNGNTSVVAFATKRDLINDVNIPNPFIKTNEFYPGFVNVFENAEVRFHMPENALYDSLRFTIKQTPAINGNTVYELKNGNVPVQCYFPVSIKREVAPQYFNKIMMESFWGGKNNFCKAEPLKDNWYKGSFRAFGNYRLIIDTLPPTITSIGFRNGMNCKGISRLAFIVIDNTEELNFTAILDGNWLRFSNDKGRTFIYKFDEKCMPGEHELKIRAEDLVGNVTEKVYNFTR
ncbi:MAG: M23 family metallopeptidase, partial [Sphingobacteriales bacterium]|nr:M23 family metallopeptidase [Sphingobacteriales bacterium]